MNTTELLLTSIGTLLIIWFSWWASIKEKRYHGYYRFFSFESILLLLILNYHVWTIDPLSIRQIISQIALFLSLYPVIQALALFRRHGRPEGRFENTTQLIVSGLYRFIRHPMYASLALFGFSVYLKQIGNWQTLLFIVNTIAVYLTAKQEEAEMKAKFGPAYLEYMKKSKMFIPFVF
jgi:protein-S-isoprenylcysteine O-methyltransferase Ste14